MSTLRINLACGDYDRTRALKDGVVKVEGIDLNYIALKPEEIFWRMFQYEEFDASELSMSGYIIERTRGVHRFLAIPVFPSRMFRHSCIYINSDAGIQKPEDLKGKVIGVPEYHMTAALWVRGFLQHEYGVKPSDVIWRTGGQEQPGRKERVELRLPPGIVVEPIPKDETLNAMLREGKIAALISPHMPILLMKNCPNVKRLFPDYRRMEEEYYKKTRLFPIMHTIVVKESLYRENPWAARNLYNAFKKAKDLTLREMYDTGALRYSIPWLIHEIEQEREIFGEDLWPYGVETNRHVIEKMIQFSYEQGLAEKIIPVEELFARVTLDDFKI
jgi:4,5-dihydroxyphthalate decarboxylase